MKAIPAALLFCLAATPALALDAGALYGGDLEFEIRRNGAPIGRHTVRFTTEAGGLRAEAASDLTVRFLGIPFYRMRYRSISDWQDGQLVRLDARSDDNGAVQVVRASRDGDLLRIEGSNGPATAPAALPISDHFHPGVIGTGQLLNTITGRLNRVQMVAEAREAVETGGDARREATRYAYRGELEAHVWYDDAGRWVGLQFQGRDGSTVRYVCRRCGPADAVPERAAENRAAGPGPG